MASREEVLQKAKERGFTVHAQSGDKSWYLMMTGKSPIGLHLYPNTNEFELVYGQGIFQLRSGKCGSFTDDKHFSGIANQAHQLALRLKKEQH